VVESAGQAAFLSHVLRDSRSMSMLISRLSSSQGAWDSAHSARVSRMQLALALAELRIVNASSAPVEPAVALRIVRLANQSFSVRRGDATATARGPWLEAFTFGLLHGFGFAGTPTKPGLPQVEIPRASFAFNLGAQIGQPALFAAVLTVTAIAHRIDGLVGMRGCVTTGATYAIGGRPGSGLLSAARK